MPQAYQARAGDGTSAGQCGGGGRRTVSGRLAAMNHSILIATSFPETVLRPPPSVLQVHSTHAPSGAAPPPDPAGGRAGLAAVPRARRPGARAGTGLSARVE